MNKKVIGISIDDEFTSFDMIGGDLLTLGMVEVYEDLTLGREFYGEFKPRAAKYFSEKAEEVHGISYFKAMTFQDAEKTCMDLMQWLSPLMDQFPLVTLFWGSWNFDLKWIDITMERCGFKSSFLKAFTQTKDSHINVLKLAKQKLKHMPLPKRGTEQDKKKGQYSLANVARFYDMPVNHHNSLWDAKACAEIYCRIMKGENVWTGELF